MQVRIVPATGPQPTVPADGVVGAAVPCWPRTTKPSSPAGPVQLTAAALSRAEARAPVGAGTPVEMVRAMLEPVSAVASVAKTL